MNTPSSPSAEAVVRVAREAMATRFEIVMHGGDPVRLRAAGEEALAEIESLEDRLSLYRATSEVSRLNALASREPVQVSPPLFRLLEQAEELSRITDGAFDITVAPLMRSWGFMREGGRRPDTEALRLAREGVGMGWVELDRTSFAVRFRRPGVMIDLGGIGKGLAIDAAVARLRESGVPHALVHGGTSTAHGFGCQPDGRPWRVAVQLPPEGDSAPPQEREALLLNVPLEETSLSVSAVWGKSFREGDEVFGHIIDPRSGMPVRHTRLAAVLLPSATESDALSTGLMTLGPEGAERIAASRPGFGGVTVGTGTGEARVRWFGRLTKP
ncbi:MAG TPA: FAD:protein FMN transferase [Verrucomicrobiales bacterium]|nr:FAD:protein FMN transferase [Verrucomicrobiales bacterium]